MLPASDKLTPLFAAIEGLRCGAPPPRAEELPIEVVETVVAALSDGPRAPAGAGAWEIAAGDRSPCALSRSAPTSRSTFAGMAAMAGLSKHHFLRVVPPLCRHDALSLLSAGPDGARRAPAGDDPRSVIAIALDAASAISRPSTPASARLSEPPRPNIVRALSAASPRRREHALHSVTRDGLTVSAFRHTMTVGQISSG